MLGSSTTDFALGAQLGNELLRIGHAHARDLLLGDTEFAEGLELLLGRFEIQFVVGLHDRIRPPFARNHHGNPAPFPGA